MTTIGTETNGFKTFTLDNTMNYAQLTVDALKDAALSLRHTGYLNEEAINKAILLLNIGIDAAFVKGEPTIELEQYLKALEQVKDSPC